MYPGVIHATPNDLLDRIQLGRKGGSVSMIAVTASLPSDISAGPPIVLVHGGANSAMVWTYWQRELADLGWSSYAIDLRGHGKSDPIDLSDTSMRDYADDVKRLVDELKQPPVIIGWSMGGLVAQMAATSGTIAVWVGLEPSPPVLQVDSSLTLRNGVFDSAEYGIADPDPHTQTTMPDLDIEERKVALASLGLESRRARDERKRGIVSESVPCPFLVVNGTLSRDRSEKGHVERLASDRLVVEGASHWGLVLNRRALRTLVPDVLNWISGAAQRTQGA